MLIVCISLTKSTVDDQKKYDFKSLPTLSCMTSYNFIIYFINRYWYWYFKPHNQQLKLHSNDHENAFIVVTMIRNWFAIKWEQAKTCHIDFSSFINAKFISVSFAQRYSRRSEKKIFMQWILTNRNRMVNDESSIAYIGTCFWIHAKMRIQCSDTSRCRCYWLDSTRLDDTFSIIAISFV